MHSRRRRTAGSSNQADEDTIYFCGPRRMLGYAPMLQDFLACLADRSRRLCSDFRRARREFGIVLRTYAQLNRTPPP